MPRSCTPILLASNAAATSPAHRNAASTTEFIRNSCRATQYLAVCQQSLSSYGGSARSPRKLAHTALFVSAGGGGARRAAVRPQQRARAGGPLRDCLDGVFHGVDAATRAAIRGKVFDVAKVTSNALTVALEFPRRRRPATARRSSSSPAAMAAAAIPHAAPLPPSLTRTCRGPHRIRALLLFAVVPAPPASAAIPAAGGRRPPVGLVALTRPRAESERKGVAGLDRAG
ncbi:hypothetical protein ACP70R_017501 [Stipagrostis hirtigluma subsp. patula]